MADHPDAPEGEDPTPPVDETPADAPVEAPGDAVDGGAPVDAPEADAPVVAPEAPGDALAEDQPEQPAEALADPPDVTQEPPAPRSQFEDTTDVMGPDALAALIAQAQAAGQQELHLPPRLDDDAPPPEDEPGAPPPAPEETPEEFVARMVPVLEGMIFAADHPLVTKDALALLTEEGEVMATTERVELAIDLVRQRYSGERAGIVLVDVAGGVAFRTGSPAGRYLRRTSQEKPFRMGRAALETLAIVAYRQPVTKSQVDELRGVDSSGALKTLLDKNLIRVLGKAEEVGRPLLYGTSKTFLEAFGLRVLSDLPTLREYMELTEENRALVDAQAPVQALGRIRDLAQPGARIISEEAEAEGVDALKDLDKAVGEANSSGKAADIVLKAGGKLPPGMDLERITRPPSPAEGEEGEDPNREDGGASEEPPEQEDTPSARGEEEEDPNKEAAE